MADLRSEGMHGPEPAPAISEPATSENDAVLLHLREAQAAYAAARVRAQIQDAGLRDTREQLERVQAAHSGLTRELEETRQLADREKDELHRLHAREKEHLHRRLTQEKTQVEQEKAQVEQEKAQVEQEKAQVEQQVAQETQKRAAQEQDSARQRERADRLERIIKELHQELFSSNIYTLILRACLTITEATHGLYVTVRQGEDVPRVRAAIGFDNAGAEPLSPPMAALCRRVLGDGEPLLLNAGADRSSLPPAAAQDKDIHNAVVVPVVLRKNFNGVMLVANKDGDFDRDDADAIISDRPSNTTSPTRSCSLEWWSNHSPQPGTYGTLARMSLDVTVYLPSCISLGCTKRYESISPIVLSSVAQIKPSKSDRVTSCIEWLLAAHVAISVVRSP